MILKNLKWPLTMLVLFLGLAFFYSKQEKEKTTTTNSKETKNFSTPNLAVQGKKKASVQKTTQHNHSHHHDEENEIPNQTEEVITFSYKKESQKLIKLIESFPESKPELLKIIKSDNPFKDAEAHSLGEINQRQTGALKVLALKSIFQKEQNKNALAQDLLEISKTAQDSTIAKMAEAALEALKEERPFFKDYVDGLSNLNPVED